MAALGRLCWHVLVMASMAFVPACGRAGTDPVILALGDQKVRRSEFERYAVGMEARGQTSLDPAVRRALLEAFLERRVLVLEARARGLLAPGAGPDQEGMAVQQLLARQVLSRVQVSDGEVEAYYDQHRAEFTQPEAVTLRQILVATPNEARDVRRRLQKEPRSFVALAQTLSRAPEASAGGLMGTFSRGQLPPELEKAAFALEPGRVSPVVESGLGHHVLRVEAREGPREPTLEECRERIRERLIQEKTDQQGREFVRALLARARVTR